MDQLLFLFMDFQLFGLIFWVCALDICFHAEFFLVHMLSAGGSASGFFQLFGFMFCGCPSAASTCGVIVERHFMLYFLP